MSEKLVVGPINNGLVTNREPFVIDNDSFPVLQNAYQWRGRIKRKRGTSPLGRLQITIGTTDGSGDASITILPTTIATGIVSFVIGDDVFVDPGTTADPATQTLITNSAGTGTLNRTTGVLTITGSQLSTDIIYYPSLPVMGLEALRLDQALYAGTIGFDTTYSYNIPTAHPYTPYNVSFYKNPATATYTGYTAKGTQTSLWWNGEDYQQFWSSNYQNAFWATNGIATNPVNLNAIGMQFNTINAVAIGAAGPPAFVTITTGTNHGLVIGDFVFINEIVGMTGINFQTGYVTAVPAANQITVELPNATVGGAWASGGIVQYLTNRIDTTKDCIRWYDGDPTTASSPLGWVNFCPPLFSSSSPAVTLADLPPAQYYLVSCRILLPFKDRMMFFGPVVQTSSGSPIYLQDTIIYSQNGTPYYTCSFTGSETSSATVFNPILLPSNQTATANAYFSDVTGYGGFVTAGVSQPIISVGSNQDVLIIGFGTNLQTKLVYTGNDILPFEFYITNSELGSSSTFSTIQMNEGVITKGNRGYLITDQTGSQRIDLINPDQVFEVKLLNNGANRVTAVRDFVNEWIYFTYPSNYNSSIYPTTTFLYNYRDQSWAIFRETYTTYGAFQPSSGYTWATLETTWESWNDPWNSGDVTLLQNQVIAGNQQGFVVFRSDNSTYEADSLSIQNIVAQVITSPSHCLNNGDFIIINNCKGDMGTQVNGIILKITAINTDTITVTGVEITETYEGGGTIQRMYVPFIQTRQFPVSWGFGRKTRIGAQQYLLTKTPNGQITVNLYLNENVNNAYNIGSIVPTSSPSPQNNALIYNQTVYTSPQFAIQSCYRNSLGSIGDGVITSFTYDYSTIFSYRDLGFVPGSVYIKVGSVATFTDDGEGGFTVTGTGTTVGSSIDYVNSEVTIAFSSAPTSQPTTTNFQYYYDDIQNPTASQQQQIWHRMNTSLLGDTIQLGFTISDEQMQQVDRDGAPTSGFSEVELHGFTMDLSPSSLLA